MKAYLSPSIKLTIILVILLGAIYPLAIMGIGKLSPGNGGGVTAEANGKVVGYENIGQSFTADDYFWGRPSAVNYNATGSGGSNKGPTNPEYLSTVQSRIDSFMLHNPGIEKNEIPVDLITASGSGLDPHISLQAARIQVKRIAAKRNIQKEKIEQLIEEQAEQPLFGMFGPSRINVLKLNIALDQLK